MAITSTRTRAAASDGKLQMSPEEFKLWLKQFDVDGDGRINKKELQMAIKTRGGGWFTSRKSARGVAGADSNGDGFIDDDEIGNLTEFAKEHLGIRVVLY
ncbi:EF-hand domain [Dillenia turbinata]|uniref:EF-hand domain n=1 Tax=Dillenia turbinata TaxID=194707 RepID=A0AAN8UVY6_9MAGN